MLSSIDPIVGLLAVIVAGTVAFFGFRMLDRHASRRSD
jgi:hypothetical protein